MNTNLHAGDYVLVDVTDLPDRTALDWECPNISKIVCLPPRRPARGRWVILRILAEVDPMRRGILAEVVESDPHQPITGRLALERSAWQRVHCQANYDLVCGR